MLSTRVKHYTPMVSLQGQSLSTRCKVMPVLIILMAVIIVLAVVVASAAKFVVPSLNYPATISVAALVLAVWVVRLLKAVKSGE